MHKALVFAGLASLGLAGQAFADDGFSYSYLESHYVNVDIDGVGKNPDGFDVIGSFALSSMLHGFADYTRVSYSGTTVQAWVVGMGVNHSVSSNIDLIGRAGYVRGKIEGFGDDDGLLLEAGVRGRPVGSLELEGLIDYTSTDDSLGDNTSLKLNARYFFVPQFAVDAGVDLDDDVKTWNIGFRWNFK